MKPVPNFFPTLSAPYRIAIIGEAPGKDEEALGRPFVGASGRLLDQLLSKAGIIREACFIGNVCQYRPPGNVIAEFDWDGEEIQSGLAQLNTDLRSYKPHLIVCLGATALHAFKEGNVPLKKRKAAGDLKFVYPNSIDSWRGSLFLSAPEGLAEGAPCIPNTKCLAAHHPAFCLRAYENTALLMMDLNKAAREGKFPELRLPLRNLHSNPPFQSLLGFLHMVRHLNKPIALDIEGYYTGMTCISIAINEADSTIIPFQRSDGSSYWSAEEETQLLRGLSALLADPSVPKVWQNGLYDRWVLQYGYHMPVLGNADDTMLKWWEKYCELPKGLDTQASILTEEPYYKSDRKSEDDITHYRYCCKDSALTYEINEKLTPLLRAHCDTATTHYRFNHALLNVLLYIELRGICYDKSLARERLHTTRTWIQRLQCRLDRLSGAGISHTTSNEARLNLIRDTMCFKRDSSKPKKEYEDSYPVAITLAGKPTLTEEEEGYLSIALGLDMNIKSPKFKDYLYKTLALPEQYNKTSGAVTTDSLALLKLSKRHPHPALDLAIEIGFLRTRSQMLEISADPDGRIRCGYNIVGTNTGRITCYTSPTGSGYNLQTIPDEDQTKPEGHPLRQGMRDLIIADPGHWFFQCDLKGSDGWTIGAHLSRLGDPTMLDDLRSGIKPASRIAYMLRHGNDSLKRLTRDDIRERLKEVKKTDWDYFACKVGIWGICYLMGPDLLADQIFEESDGKIVMSRKEVTEFRNAVMTGYNVGLWHTWMARQLAIKPEITAASGHKRRFYGRTTEVLGAALSHEPQANTTYATNMAAYRLWTDPANRTDRLIYTPKGDAKRIPFVVEPLHQVHDALLGQFPQDRTEWSTNKIRSWFDNPLTIAGQRIVIPFEGHYGPSWGQQDKGTI